MKGEILEKRELETRVTRFLPWFLPLVILIFHGSTLNGFFILDDWDLLGPGVAREFLANPFSIFGSLQVVHYVPVAKLFYALLSLLFGTAPLPYHAVCLGLLMVSALLLYRYLLFVGISPLSSLLGAAYFSIAPPHLQVTMWVTCVNYILLGIFLIQGLYHWEAYLKGGGKKPLVFSLVYCFLAQYTHTVGVLLPLLLILRSALAGRDGRAVSGRTATIWGAVALAGVALLQGVPRFFLTSGGAPVQFTTTLSSSLGVVWSNISQVVIPGFLGLVPLDPEVPLPPTLIPAYLLGGLACLSLLAWCVTRIHWRVVAIGILLALGAWLLPLLVVKNSELLIYRHRFHYIPDLGFSLAIAGIFDFSAGFMGNRIAALTRFLPALVLGLVLLASGLITPVVRETFLSQDRYVQDTALKYVQRINAIIEASPCPEIVIHDFYLTDSMPRGVQGTSDILLLDHATIHRFYFGHRPGSGPQVRFIPCRFAPTKAQSPPGCEFIAFGPALHPVK